MGVPLPNVQAADESTVEAVLAAFTDIAAAERRKHAIVLNYWLTIRGNKNFPTIRDFDPLEIPDAGPSSVLLELIGAGEDADIRHIGQALSGGAKVERISDVPGQSILAHIAENLPAVASTCRPLAFERELAGAEGNTRCWVTLLPFSSTETWADYVYGFISTKAARNAAEQPAEELSSAAEPEPVEASSPSTEAEPVEDPAPAAEPEQIDDPAPFAEAEPAVAPEPHEAPEHAERAGFSADIFNPLELAKSFFGTTAKASPKPAPAAVAEEEPEPEPVATAEPEPEPEPTPELDQTPEPEPEPTPEPEAKTHSTREGTLHDKLVEIRSKADEARLAKLRAEAALWEGLGAAYDFALDAEENAEDYLKLVEAQGIKIQLRSPMAPVARLAFDGSCDPAIMPELEAVLAWALASNLPRGTLAERIEAEGGIGGVLRSAKQR